MVSKPSDSKPSDSKPSDSKPSDSKPSDSKPSDEFYRQIPTRWKAIAPFLSKIIL
ncbi:hypothetical protein [Spirulina sp. 06S082]|uniref:hypothetical protein n=1 Tax=Spirulina sp. 06S082 TaxID=3110248 RepID=UPI002B21575F|nr:hypothetical protein [Spirulina sp. 06S082]MEA5469273.1 hypothetical protein [Spirulina sp. 06S082]